MLLTLLSFAFVFTLGALSHEFGHFISAKRSGIRVYEFALGFGPRLFSFRRGETIYAINLIPVLGYVKIAGTEDDEEDKACPEDQKYYNKPVISKFLLSFLGPFMNLLLAFVILTLIFSFVGVPKDISNEIDKIAPNSPAEKIGLLPGDKILSIDGRPVVKMENSIDYIHKNPNKLMTLKIARSGKIMAFKVAPKFDPKLKVGLIGFNPKPIYIKVNFLSAIYYGFQQTLSMIVLMFIILGKLIVGGISLKDLAGPVGIAQISGKYAQSGLLVFMHFVAFLNVNIGVLNLLPLPALDGGRIVFILIEALTGKPIDNKIENRIHQFGFYLLLALMALVTLNDILRILRPK